MILCLLNKHRWGLYRCRDCNKLKPFALRMAFNNMDENVILMILKTKQAPRQIESIHKKGDSVFELAIRYHMVRVLKALLVYDASLLQKDKNYADLKDKILSLGDEELHKLVP